MIGERWRIAGGNGEGSIWEKLVVVASVLAQSSIASEYRLRLNAMAFITTSWLFAVSLQILTTPQHADVRVSITIEKHSTLLQLSQQSSMPRITKGRLPNSQRLELYLGISSKPGNG